MDAFYAAVEQRDRPELRGRPVIVGGSPEGRGVVCTASYEARAFGVRSAMPSARALRLCPDAVFLTPDFERYAAVSRQVREIFLRYTDLVEPLSLDEAYLDVTENKFGIPSGTWAAKRIRAEVKAKTGLTCSAGVAPSKFVAKVASDLKKPDGLVVVRPDQVRAFVARLPVRRVPGIGPVTERECRRRGIEVCGDFLGHDPADLERWFGRAGRRFYRLAQGEDSRPVVPSSERKSCSVEDTFPTDLERAELFDVLFDLARRLAVRMQRHAILGRRLTLKVRFSDFRTITRSRSFDDPPASADEIGRLGARLLLGAVPLGARVRLLGLGFSNLFRDAGRRQTRLPFVDPGASCARGANPEPGAAQMSPARRVRDERNP